MPLKLLFFVSAFKDYRVMVRYVFYSIIFCYYPVNIGSEITYWKIHRNLPL